MKFAVVTPSFNKAPYLRRSLLSVLEQDQSEVDYVVLDNCSTDGSIDILNEFRIVHGDKLRVLIERDNGQAAAINRGFTLVDGEIMGWLNADDSYLPQTLATVAAFFKEHPDVDLVYGKTRILDGNLSLTGDFPVQPHSLKVLRSYDYIPQPAAFWRRRVWDVLGPLDESLNWGLDWDFFIRVSEQFTVECIDEVLAEAVCDGQHKTATGGLAKTRELARIGCRHGGWRNPTFLYCNYVLAIHWLTRPFLKHPATRFAARTFLERLEAYTMTMLSRLFRVQVMS